MMEAAYTHRGQARMHDVDTHQLANLTAAVAGAAASQIMSTKVVTVRRMAALGFVGAATGIFAGPGICTMAGITLPTIQALMHFAVGFTGIALCSALMSFAETGGIKDLLARALGHPVPVDPPAPPTTTSTSP
jgi:hypothetical protein